MSQKHRDPAQPQQPQPSPDDSRRLKDFEKVGPHSIDGLEASELPDKGRGDVFTDPAQEGKRRLPQETGETVGPGSIGEAGLRAEMDVGDADRHGGRKRN